jgi:predicted phage tail protein
MTEVILHGLLEKKFKKKYTFSNLKCTADCVQMIDCTSKGFKKFIIEQSMNGVEYEFITDGEKNKSSEDVLKKHKIKKIEIVPCVKGSDPVSFFVVLVYSLLIAGIVYLMTPIPEIEPSETGGVLDANARSFFFENDQNIAAQGIAVPLGYGRLRVGSKIISAHTKHAISPFTRDTYTANSEDYLL